MYVLSGFCLSIQGLDPVNPSKVITFLVLGKFFGGKTQVDDENKQPTAKTRRKPQRIRQAKNH
ncbi:MAG: hypothetical protein CMI32_06060 [Opitutales bacterium]|nr:hypothetical protein [Opitutales bacterium]